MKTILLILLVAVSNLFAQKNDVEKEVLFDRASEALLTNYVISVPVVPAPTFNWTSVLTDSFLPSNQWEKAQISVAQVPFSHLTLTNVDKLATSVDMYAKFYSAGGDLRHSRNISDTLRNEWQQLLSTYTNALAPTTFNLSQVRMIAEVATPETPLENENQVAELAYFKSIGYNGALIVWRGENPRLLAAVASELKSQGWILGFAFGPTGETSVYLPAKSMRNAFKAILPYCDFVVGTWRGTSVENWINGKDAWFRTWTGLIREAAPDIPIFGEAFWSSSSRDFKVMTEPSISGHVLVGVGYDNLPSAMVVGAIMERKIATPCFALIVGPVPYYKTVYNKGYTDAKIRAYCTMEENGYLQNKEIAGTITLAGDGYGERLYNNVMQTDSLTKTKWRQAEQ